MDELTDRRVAWDECPAYARYLSEDGSKEIVVVCNLNCHAPPEDLTAWHEDEELGIRWQYLDD